MQADQARHADRRFGRTAGTEPDSGTVDDRWIVDSIGAEIVFASGPLTIRTVSPNDLFLMKLDAGRAQDLDDLNRLWPHCTFGSPADADAHNIENGVPVRTGFWPGVDRCPARATSAVRFPAPCMHASDASLPSEGRPAARSISVPM